MRRALGFSLTAVAAVIAPAPTFAVPFWGATESLPADTDPDDVKPGQFVWDPAAAPDGPMTVVVSLSEQRAFVYRNGVLIGVASASTGKPGHTTPTGVFTVLQKDKDHHSKTYNNAPMPYAERLTWGGVALHAGELPGYPSSHGCVHLPSAFAQKLFAISSMGMVVVIADDDSAPREVAHPTMLAPVSATSGADDLEPPLAADQQDRWEPEKSPTGPVSIVVSAGDRRMVVLRNGVEIGRARIGVKDPGTPVGTHVFVVADGGTEAAPKWIAVGVPGHAAEAGRPLDPTAAARVTMPADFRRNLRPLLVPGTTLLVTDGAIRPDTTGPRVDVVNADPPAADTATN